VYCEKTAGLVGKPTVELIVACTQQEVLLFSTIKVFLLRHKDEIISISQ
jgi:hypothetical protein